MTGYRGPTTKRLPLKSKVRYTVVYAEIRKYNDQHGRCPSVRRLAAILNQRMSYSTVRKHVNDLKDDGLLIVADRNIGLPRKRNKALTA